jgi:ABC-type phosphate/phosphonate transport system substrate-binding protein
MLPVVLFATSALAADTKPLVLLVMDPLSLPLACDCVQGYAQRKYEKLGSHLEKALGRKVDVVWAESLAKGAKEAGDRPADIVIGKHSVILCDAKKEKRSLEPVASLTGKDGKTTQTGLIVVRKDDPALAVEALAGYRIIFGPADCDEKSAAPIALLKSKGVAITGEPETAATCSLAATELVKLPATEKAAAVISSYAEPLLAGCGAIQQGDLRIVGVTEPLPFITAFVNSGLSKAERDAIQSSLLDVGKHSDLLVALETKSGFVPYREPPKVAEAKKK